VDKIKFILIGLAGLLVMSLFFTFQAFNAKQATERERDSLKKENETLALKINESLQDSQRFRSKLSSLSEAMDRVTQEKDEFQSKYLTVTQEKDDLVEKLKAKQSALVSTAAQPAVVTDDTYWGGILKDKADLELQVDNLRKDFRDMQIKNEELQKDKNALELEIRSQVREKQDYKRQMEYNQKLIYSISQELVREKNDKFQIEDSLKMIKVENSTLRKQLKSLNNRKIVLDKKLSDLQNKSVNLERGFNEMGEMLNDKMAQIDNLRRQIEPARVSTLPVDKKEEAVELSPIVVRPQAGTAVEEAPSVFSGKVIAVKRENNFVIVDLGENDGVITGDTLQVFRGGEMIADMEVIQTRKDISACGIKKETAPIKIGDTVR
jgi:chromosome segregation ATPase